VQSSNLYSSTPKTFIHIKSSPTRPQHWIEWQSIVLRGRFLQVEPPAPKSIHYISTPGPVNPHCLLAYFSGCNSPIKIWCKNVLAILFSQWRAILCLLGPMLW
jgi:hypothetical protein